MTTKTTKTAKTEKAVIHAETAEFISQALAYQKSAEVRDTAMALLEDARNSMNGFRKSMVPFMQKHRTEDWATGWKKLSPIIKEELSKMEGTDAVGWLGVFKTCFQYKVMPIRSNADRMRKAKSWINWAGVTVQNTYGKVHAKAETPKTNEPPKAAPKASAQQSTAKVEPPKASAQQSTPKAEPPKTVNVAADDAMTPFDVWNQYFDRFMEHGVTHHYLGKLAGLMNVQPIELQVAMIKAKADLNADAERLLAKK